MEPESSATIAVDGARIAYRRIGKDRRGVDLISDVLPFGRLWYGEVADAIGHAKFLQTLTTLFHLPLAFGDSEAASF